ncbi:MAG: DUF4032 domain-containing protein [Verrucomicrobia bacterium]|nr:DUF4032 domain-containing protein [Verrucomicrobiota bacterium]
MDKKENQEAGNPGRNGVALKSTLYQEFLEERSEILRHKWLESEKARKDIGFERALLDWVRHYRSNWKASRRNEVGSS